MKLLPFVLKQKHTSSFTVSSLSLFLTHAGKGIWKTEEPGVVSLEVLERDYCEPNGLVLSHAFLDAETTTAYLQVDPAKTSLSDFYTWEEALAKPTKPECWRTFYFFEDKEEAFWWSPQGIVEAELPEIGSVQTILSYLRTKSVI